jgi:hypothetical protein
MHKLLVSLLSILVLSHAQLYAQFDVGQVTGLLQQILQENIQTKTYALATKIAGEDMQKATDLMKKMKLDQGNIAFRMAQLQALNSHSMLMQQAAGGKTVTLPTTGYILGEGGKLMGADWGFIDNLMGNGGMPISLDRQLPSNLFPLVGSDAVNLKSIASQAMSKLGTQAIQAASDLIMGKVYQTAPMAAPVASQALGSATQAAKGMIGDGTYVRDYIPTKDDAYVMYAVNGSPSQKMAYYASPLYEANGKIYDAVRGVIPEQQASLAAPDLSNTITAGAYQAWQDIRTKLVAKNPDQEIPTNPYEGYATYVFPEILAAMKNAKPGEAITITPEMVKAARARKKEVDAMIPTASSKIPSIMPQQTAGSSGGGSSTGSGSGSGAKFGDTLKSAAQQAVMVIQPTAKESEEYQSWIAASDKRLAENTKDSKKKTEERKLIDAQLQSLAKLSQEAQALMKCMKPNEAIPELPQMVERINEQINLGKKDLNKLDKDIEDLSETRNAELRKREDYRREFAKGQEAMAPLRYKAALMQGQK